MRVFWAVSIASWIVCGWFFFHLVHEADSMTTYWLVGGAVAALAGLLVTCVWFRYAQAEWSRRLQQ